MGKHLYFIALVPPQDIAQKVTRFKRYAAEHFDSRHALKSPPHITIIPPFQLDQKGVEKLQIWLPARLHAIQPFPVELRNFAAFVPRVIYVDVVSNSSLQALQTHLKSSFQQEFGFQPDRRQEYHPHMTIAFKDLSKKMFRQAWAYFAKQEFDAVFKAKHVTLLKHTGQIWQVDAMVNFAHTT